MCHVVLNDLKFLMIFMLMEVQTNVGRSNYGFVVDGSMHSAHNRPQKVRLSMTCGAYARWADRGPVGVVVEH